MVSKAEPVGENRYRERFGRYYEDFKQGDIYEHRPNRTLTETDNTWFTLLTMNTHPMHFDAEYAKHRASAPKHVAICRGIALGYVRRVASAGSCPL